MRAVLEESTFLNPFLYILQWSLCRFGNRAAPMAKWKSSLLLPWVGSHVLAPLCDFAGRLYLLRTGAGSRSAAAFTAQVRVGGPWLLIQSPKFSRGPHLCPRTSSATWHLSLDESGPFFVRRRTRLPATPHSACCWATMRWRIAAPIIPCCEMSVCVSVCVFSLLFPPLARFRAKYKL